MKIDQYIPADPHVATEVGVELNYKVSLGGGVVEFNFRAKSSGIQNKAFQKAAGQLSKRRAVQEQTGFIQEPEDALADTMALWYDHAIINWNTTAKSGGKTIKNTRENFIKIFSMKEGMFVGVFTQLAADCGDISNFTKEAEAAAVKNSQNTSTGK